ncbi:hypothetical protein BH09ACT3_BH09ACT3_12680 [soil metagenome]
MIKTPRIIAVTAAIAIGLLATPALAGCSVQGLVKNATGGQVDLGDGGSKPADFPSSIPLIEGKIIASAGLGSGVDRVWNLTVETGGSNPYEKIKSDMAGAGFEITGNVDMSSEEGGAVFFTDDTFGVAIVVGKSDANWTANYTVTPVAE